jgi:hypothetical protein
VQEYAHQHDEACHNDDGEFVREEDVLVRIHRTMIVWMRSAERMANASTKE